MKVIKISEESHLIKENPIQPEQETCSCGCKGQENVDFQKNKQNPVNQLHSESGK